MTDYLTLNDVLEIAARLGQVRDLGLLQSAATRPRMTAFGEEAYPDLADKAGALMHSLARNHTLVDGNKRLAWVATWVFGQLNGTDYVYPVDDAEQLVLAVARGELEAADIASSLASHSVPL